MQEVLPPTPKKKILIVDDDARLRDAVEKFLTPHSYTVASLPDGREILAEVRNNPPNLVLLDVMLPGEDGFTVLQRLRTVSPVPVLMLTARGDDVDRIIGLEMGADDYLAKPFNPRELLARIKAVLRRAMPGALPAADFTPPPAQDEVLRAGAISLDVRNQTLRHQGRDAALSATECRLARVLLAHRDMTLSRDQLLNLAFGSAYCANDRLIDVHISRLRRIVRELGDESGPIRTVWGAGYKWVCEQR